MGLVLVDTREPLATAYVFPGEDHERRCLDFGDYAPAECPNRGRIERKTLQDYVATVTTHHARFLAELARAWDARCRLVVVVEATKDDVCSHRFEGLVSPNAVLGATRSLEAYGVPVLWAINRAGGIAASLDLLRRWRRHARVDNPVTSAG